MFRINRMVATGVSVGVVVSGGVAFATIPGPDGTITGCYTKNAGVFDAKGAVRVVDAGSECRSSELVLTWNQTGPPGPAGLQGPPGEPGQDGADGHAESHVWFAQQTGTKELIENTPVTILSANVPAGSYRVDGRLDFDSLNHATDVRCQIAGILAARHFAQSTGHGFTTTPLELTVALVHPGGPLDLTCHGDNHGRINAGTLLVTQVTSVN